jgi:hypothetical protein
MLYKRTFLFSRNSKKAHLKRVHPNNHIRKILPEEGGGNRIYSRKKYLGPPVMIKDTIWQGAK